MNDRTIIFDTETTGLIENRTLRLDRQSEITEVCVIAGDLDTGASETLMNTLVKPRGKITDENVKQNGIFPEMVTDAPTFREIAEELKRHIESAKFAIAHNASFDQEMIDIEMERIGVTVTWPRLICTIEQTMHLLGRRLSLSDLHQYLFGEPFAGAHRAAVDVAATWRCCVELRKRGEL